MPSFIWQWYSEATALRRQGFNGPDPLSWADWQAWLALTGHIVRREELAILRAMDAAWCFGILQEKSDIAEREAAIEE